jgi:hypothetical protein
MDDVGAAGVFLGRREDEGREEEGRGRVGVARAVGRALHNVDGNESPCIDRFTTGAARLPVLEQLGRRMPGSPCKPIERERPQKNPNSSYQMTS